MNQHSNFDVVNVLIEHDGSYSTWEHINMERHPWGTRDWYVNALGGRRKLCPWCSRRQPIAEFIVENDVLRTVVAHDVATGTELAFVCADVREWCAECEKRRLNA